MRPTRPRAGNARPPDPPPAPAVLPQFAAPPLSPAALQQRATDASGLLKTLSHPARLMLVCTLVEGEHGVGALEARTGIGQPTLSQQLGVLREAGIVETRREAKQIFYRLTDARAAQLVAALHSIFCTGEGQP